MASRLQLSEDDIYHLSDYLRKQRQAADNAYTAPPGITKNPLIAGGEGLKQAGLGALKTVFNMLDQPKSAIVGGLTAAFSKKNRASLSVDPFTAFFKGLTGQQHYSTSDMLKQDFGVKNKLALAVGGFAGDIAFDPLTYVGLAPVRGLSEGEAAAKALQQVHEGVTAGQIGMEQIPSAIADTTQQLMKENPYKFKIEVGLPGHKAAVASVAQPLVANKVRQFVKGPEGDPRRLVEMFSRRAEQPFGLADASRNIEGKLAGDANRNQRALLKLHNEVSPESRRIAALAYEDPSIYAAYANDPLVTRDHAGGIAGRILNGGDKGSALAQARDGGINTIGEYVDFVRENRRAMTEAEMEAGMNRHLLPREPDRKYIRAGGGGKLRQMTVKGDIREWQDLADYEKEAILDSQNKLLPKRVQHPNKLELVRGLHKQLGKAGETYLSPNQLTFDQLATTGANPYIDIGDSHILSMANTYRDQTRAEVTKQALRGIGIDASTEEGQAMMKGLSSRDSMGIKWVKVHPESGRGLNALDNEVAQMKEFKDVYIPEAIQRVLNTQEKVLTNNDLGAQAMKSFDKLMGHWKALNTTLNPGYMVRNAVGDFISNMADGVFDPRRYVQAHQVLSEINKNDVIDLAETLRHPAEGLRVFPNIDAPSNVNIMLGGRSHNAREIYQAGNDNGIFSGEIVTEKMKGAAADVSPSAVPSGGAALKMANIKNVLDQNVRETGTNALRLAEAKGADLNIARESNQRYAHFIDAYDKEMTGRLKSYAKSQKMNSRDLGAIRERMGTEAVGKLEADAAAKAAERVRKFNIDYGSLSTFEQKYMKKIIPFYSFFRKNAPLQMSMLFTKPGFMDKYQPTFEAMQNIMGTNDGNGDWMVPDWIRESMPVRVAAAGVQGGIISQIARFAAGAHDNTAVFLPMMQGLMPASDIGTVLAPLEKTVETGSPWQGFSEAAKQAANMTNPAIKMLYEAGHKTSTQSGAPITDWGKWLVGGTLGAPGRLLYNSNPWFGDKAVAPAVTSTFLGPQLRNVDLQAQRSEFQRRRNVANIQIKNMRQDAARRMGITDSESISKLKTPEIAAMLNWMKQAGRSIGTY